MSLSGEDLGKKLAGVLGIPTGNITELRIICKGGPGTPAIVQVSRVIEEDEGYKVTKIVDSYEIKSKGAPDGTD